jgi:hypothetical protein
MHRSIHVIINNYIIVVIPLKMAQDFLDVAQRNRLRHNISADNPYKCRPCARSYKCRNFLQALHFNICASCKSRYICAIHQVYSLTNLEADEDTAQQRGRKDVAQVQARARNCKSRMWHQEGFGETAAKATCALTRHIQSNGQVTVAQRHNAIWS